MKKLTSKLLAGFSALGLLGVQSADAQSFRSEAEARAYLTQNPTGPRAEEAFRRIIRNTIADSYPEFSRSALSDRFATTIPGGYAASVGAALSQLAAGGGVPTTNPATGAGRPQPNQSNRRSGADNDGGVY